MSLRPLTMHSLHRRVSGEYDVYDANCGTWVSRLEKQRGDALVIESCGADVLDIILKLNYSEKVTRAIIKSKYAEEFQHV